MYNTGADKGGNLEMRIVKFSTAGNIKYGMLDGDIVRGYHGSPFQILNNRRAFYPDATVYKIEQVKLLAPCEPSKIVCLGLNYRSHAEEFKLPIPKTPILFLKPPTAVIGPEDNIFLPNDNRIDYECELAVVMGKEAKNISASEAFEYILGYTCFNDVTDRYAQKDDGQWTRAKGYDTFAPIGPYIETRIDPGNLLVESYVNGERRQSARTADLIFNVPEIISFISGVMTLLPGDVIATGTPSGIGPIKDGDTVEIKVEGIGTLRNNVIKAKR
jgi:2-keto-4-pentenoate hydratase/2-oxohepta-3-ene-1,7-dioic acid hydratase in catechol pathway